MGALRVVFSVRVWLKSFELPKSMAIAFDDDERAVTVARCAPAHVWSTSNLAVSASNACTSDPIANPRVVLCADALASSTNARPAAVKVATAAVPLPVKYGNLSAALVNPAIALNSASAV